MNRAYPTKINWENNPPSIATPLNDTNLNKMDSALYEIDGRVVEFDLTKANQSDLLQTIKALTYNTETGVFTFTFWNGSTYTVDLNIEKIPVDFSMDEYGVITMTTADGTQYTCDISELVKLYTFVDSSEIDFTVTTDASGNKNVTAGIKEGSIVGSKLQPNFLADCQAASSQAQTAAGNASTSATTAESSSEDSEAWAVGERNGQPVPSTDPAYENNAKWWAQHGAGSSFAGLSDTNFTNLQNGQIAKYNSTTQKWENTEDEGGLLPHLYIDSEAGSTVTVVAPDSSVIIPTQISSGHWECDVPSYGVYTIHAVLNGDDAVLSLTVDDVKEYHVTDSHYSYTLNVYAPTGSTIRVTATGETYTDTGAGSNPVQFALHQASTTYSIQVTLDGVSKTDSVTTPSTSGGTGSKTLEFGTINVTLDTEFIGETITCVNGGTTISKTASSTSLVFYPPTTGTWTISGTVSGTTYSVDAEVVDLNTPVSVLLKTSQTVTVTLYSATEDTVTFTDASGVQKTEVFASGQSSKSIDIEIDSSGSTITFTSSVAKNPDDLSQYYSKALTVTTNTTDLYLMPDNILYWWGYESSDIEDVSVANGWSITQTNYDPVHNTNGISFSCGAVGTSLVGLKTTVNNKTFKFIGNQTGGSTLGYCATYRSSKSNADNVIVSNVSYTAMNTLQLITMPSQANNYYFTIGFISVDRAGNLNALWYE